MYGGEPSGELYSDDDGASATSSGGGSYRGRRSRRSGAGGGAAGSAAGSARSDGDVSVLGALNGVFAYAEDTLNELSDNYTFEVRPDIRLKLRKRCASLACACAPASPRGAGRVGVAAAPSCAEAAAAWPPCQHAVGDSGRQLRGPNRAHRGGCQAGPGGPAPLEGAHARGPRPLRARARRAHRNGTGRCSSSFRAVLWLTQPPRSSSAASWRRRSAATCACTGAPRVRRALREALCAL